MKSFCVRTLFGLSALSIGFSSNAYAGITCEEIMNLVGYNIAPTVIIDTMKNSGSTFSSADIQCLKDKGAPAEVLAQAQSMSSAPSAPEVSPTAPEPVRPSIDSDEDMMGGSQGGTLQDQGESGDDPEDIKQAIKLLRAKKPLTASFQLYDMLANQKFPDQETKIHFYLASALYELEMYHTAQFYFLKVIKKGPKNPYFNYALPKLVVIAKFTGDDYELRRIAEKLPPEFYPSKASSYLFYLKGAAHFEKGEYSEALEALSKVDTNTSIDLKARYIEGVIYNKTDNLKSAVRAFRDVYTQDPGDTSIPRELEAVTQLKDLALINVASVYYGIKQYEESTKYFEKVDRRSDYWPESLFRDAWAHLHRGEYNVTLGKALTIDSPFYAEEEYIPEIQVLKSLTYFQLCEWSRVEKLIRGFQGRYEPIRDELSLFIDDYTAPKYKGQEMPQLPIDAALADQAWLFYFGPDRTGTTELPQAFFRRTLRNQELSGLVRHMDLMNQEVNLIDSQKQQWKDALGAELKSIIENNVTLYQKRAGRIFFEEVQNQRALLDDLLSQAATIEIELLEAQRAEYEFRAQNLNALSDQSKFAIDFATSPDFIYWPFNGEFWQDELGYYNYTEQGSCK